MSRIFTTIEGPELKPEHDEHEPGPFPLEALPETMRRIAVSVADVNQIDVALPGMAALATLSGAVGKSVRVSGAVNGKETHLNLFVVAGAPKSYGKGSASAVARPLTDSSRELYQEFQENERGRLLAERAILETVRKQQEKEAAQQVKELGSADHGPLDRTMQRLERIEALLKWPPSYHVGSATGAALEETLKRNGETIFSFSAEAGDCVRIALGRYTKDSNADFDLFLSGYSVEDVTPARAGRGFSTLRPCISTLWFVQPSLLRELYGSEESLERGLTARTLSFVCEHELIPFDDGIIREIDRQAAESWESLIRRTLIDRGQERILPTEPEAREAFRAFHNEAVQMRNSGFRDVEGELGRCRENAVRIAGVLAVAEGADRITEAIAQAAIRLCRWAVRSSLALLAGGRAAKMAEAKGRLLDLLAEREHTVRELTRSHGFSKGELRHVAESYPELFEVESRKPETGRPSDVMRLKSEI